MKTGPALALIAGLLLACTGFRPAAAEIAVDLELVLAVDVSGSILDENARLQRQGYAAALTDPRVIDTIRAGGLGRIAVTYVEWSDAEHQRTVVDWRVIDGPETAAAFAAALAGTPTITEDYTSISAAIDHCARLFAANSFDAARQVIDISGDGENNAGRHVKLARDAAVKDGIVINGLPILPERPIPWGDDRRRHLDRYYHDEVIGGPGAFVIVADDYTSFASAILAKLLKEIAGLLPLRPEQHRLDPSRGSADPQNFVSPAHDLRTVGHTDAGNIELSQALIDVSLVIDVQMGRAFVHKQDPGLAVQRPRKQDTLLLAARQRTHHVADQTVVRHGHGHDLIVYPGQLGALNHSFLIEDRIEEADIVGDRSR
jgi:hypothetical protein